MATLMKVIPSCKGIRNSLISLGGKAADSQGLVEPPTPPPARSLEAWAGLAWFVQSKETTSFTYVEGLLSHPHLPPLGRNIGILLHPLFSLRLWSKWPQVHT